MNIVLIGFMGSGKSTVAKYLSRSLGFSHVEMDELVYLKTGCQNMHEVFAKGGELLLRETEIAIAKNLALQTKQVISTGGGAVLNQIIFHYFKKNDSKVFFLRTHFQNIVKRIGQDTSRPLFQDLINAQKMYDLRSPLYLHFADEVVDTDFQSAEDIAAQIYKKIITNRPLA